MTDGTATIDHAGSQPLVNTAQGISIQYVGDEIATLTLQADPAAKSGTWQLQVLDGSVVAMTTIAGEGTTTKALPIDKTQTFTGAWTCQGDTLSTDFPPIGEIVTLSRVP